ncbi:MAG TPA: sigma-70 family RNA polymerase sigma factor [Vicinamibacterales bacterium]|nr:sigma-70 family RNA polymerase sigma factor [Vicinamibacterales bacterium]
MHERIDRLPGSLVTVEQDEALEREFELRLVECSTLAFRVAYSVLRQREDAEDVAQDALTRAHRSFRHLRDRERFRAWLVRVTWRLAIDRQRSDRRRVRREQDVVRDPITDPSPARDRAALLWQAIDALPEKLRLVVVLAGIEGHDMREVSALLKVPEGTVKSRLHLARQRIRERLS